jgi:hypothetical protein
VGASGATREIAALRKKSQKDDNKHDHHKIHDEIDPNVGFPPLVESPCVFKHMKIIFLSLLSLYFVFNAFALLCF